MTMRPQKVEPGWLKRWCWQSKDLVCRRPTMFAGVAAFFIACELVEVNLFNVWPHHLTLIVALAVYFVKCWVVYSAAQAADAGGDVLELLYSGYLGVMRYTAWYVFQIFFVYVGLCLLFGGSGSFGSWDSPLTKEYGSNPAVIASTVSWILIAGGYAVMAGLYLAARYGYVLRLARAQRRLVSEATFINGRIFYSIMLGAWGVSLLAVTLITALDVAWAWLVAVPVQIGFMLFGYQFFREVFEGRGENRRAEAKSAIRVNSPVGAR